jgi:hypothetical protein
MDATPEYKQPDSLTPLSQRLAGLEVHALPGALAALDAERRRREAGPPLDASELRRLLAEARGRAPSEAVALREAWVEELLTAVETKLAQRGQPELLAQGLRRLEQLLYGTPEPADPRLAAADGALAALQAAARERLLSEVGLQQLADQTGLPLDVGRHEVVSSEVGDDPARDGTVARQEAFGWLLGDAVLAPARVVRYAATSARGAAPPPDAGHWGARTDDTHPQ